MRMPVQYAICHPARVPGCAPHLDYQRLRELTFEPVDHDRFPSVGLALEAIRTGGTAGAVLNAANEAAVEAFLDDRIPFGRIPALVATALEAVPLQPASSLEIVLEADRRAREVVADRLTSAVGGR